MNMEGKDYIDLEMLGQRFNEILEKFEGTAKQFSEKSTLSEAKISKVFNKKGYLSIDDINAVIRNCSELMPSPEWFLFGDRIASANYQDKLFDLDNKVQNETYLIKRLEELATSNANLKAENEQLKANLKALEKEKIKKPEKEITEIKVYYKNNSFETYLLESND